MSLRLDRHSAAALLSFLLAAGCFAQAPAVTTVVKPAAASPEVIAWLDKLEARGKDIQSLTADVMYEKNNPLLSERQTRTGTIAFLAADKAGNKPSRFAIEFRTLIVGDALRDQSVDYLFDGAWLVERDQEKKRFIKRQVVKPGQVMDPLQIDGPFPVPIGQKREDVLARFDVALVPPAADDPKAFDGGATMHLRLTPHEDLEHSRFNKVDVWFDPQQLLPAKVVSVEDSEVTTTVALSNVKVNALSEKETASRFDTTPPASGWHVEVKSLEP